MWLEVQAHSITTPGPTGGRAIFTSDALHGRRFGGDQRVPRTQHRALVGLLPRSARARHEQRPNHSHRASTCHVRPQREARSREGACSGKKTWPSSAGSVTP